MYQITGLLWLILGNQSESNAWKASCYALAGSQFLIGIIESPLTQAFIKGFKGD